MKKTKKTWVLALTLTLIAAHATAQHFKVEFFTPNIVRVTKTPDQNAVEKKSLVVTLAPESVKVKKTTVANVTIYLSSALKVTVDEKSGKVTFAKADGTQLLTEGEYAFTPITEGIDKGAYRVKQSFALDADEPIYGIGMLQNGKMSLRGENRLMQQSNLQDYAHFFQSIKGYGIYWDNYSPTNLNDDKTLELESQVGKLVDYYFMYGGNADGVIREMRRLTGKVPMLPLWSYGFHQSRERYKSQDELLEVVRNYREMKIPFDVIVQDWRYWGSNYTWNAMDFLADEFNQPQKMIDEVHEKNAKMLISIWSSFGVQTKAFKQFKDKDLLFSFKCWPVSGLNLWPPRNDYPSGARIYDAYNPEARDIYWENLSNLHKMGIDGWWMDATEPDQQSYKDSDLDEMGSTGSFRSVRNIYPFMTVGGVDQHQRAVDNKKRVFILTRSYFAGQQRYGANTWSGDGASSWETFRNQIPLCLNYTLTANPNVNTDIGGFFANSYNRGEWDSSGAKNPQFQELYVRWMQFGLFNPMMRSHGCAINRELYYYGKPGEPVYDALLSAVKMRYNLLPYIYSTSWQVSKNDDSFMRALFMDFKDDKHTWDLGKQFMFGRSMLVCPVVNPLFTNEKYVKTDELTGWNKKDSKDISNDWPKVNWSEKKHYEVYLPAGTQWYDYWTNEKFNGGQKIMANAPLTHSPLYIKAGSILPIGQDLQFVNEKSWDNITLRVYPGANATFTLYEDEGDNYNYQKGQYTEIPMIWNDKTRTLTLETRNGSYSGMLESRNFHVLFVSSTGKVLEQTIKYNGQKVSVKL